MSVVEERKEAGLNGTTTTYTAIPDSPRPVPALPTDRACSLLLRRRDSDSTPDVASPTDTATLLRPNAPDPRQPRPAPPKPKAAPHRRPSAAPLFEQLTAAVVV